MSNTSMEGLKVKHTAGPWRYENGCLFSKERRLSIATVNILGSIETEPEELANAYLIASAPELLEACKRALPWMGKLIASRVHEDCVMPNDAVRTMEMLEAYIAKAEGRS